MLGWPGPVTNRQLLAWQSWLDERDREPDKQCVYLAQIALEVARIPSTLVGQPSELTLKHFLLGQSEEGQVGSGAAGTPHSPTYCPDVTKEKVERWRAKLEQMKWERPGVGPRPGGADKVPKPS